MAGNGKANRNYVRPTLVEIPQQENVDPWLYREEVFVPVALVTQVESAESALGLANGRRYDLDAAIFIPGTNRVRRPARLLEAGAIYVDGTPKHGIGYFPFGGRKDSGTRRGVGYTIGQVTAMKSIICNHIGKGVWEHL